MSRPAGRRPGGEPGRNGSEVRCRDGASAGHAEPAGGGSVSASAGHAAQQDGLRAASAHQAEPGAGDRHLQAPAGGRGSVSTSVKVFFFITSSLFLSHFTSDLLFILSSCSVKEILPPPKSEYPSIQGYMHLLMFTKGK